MIVPREASSQRKSSYCANGSAREGASPLCDERKNGEEPPRAAAAAPVPERARERGRREGRGSKGRRLLPTEELGLSKWLGA